MRKALFSLACLATIGLASASADVTYKYVTDAPSFQSSKAGEVVKINLYLEETVTATGTSNQSIIFKDGGLFGGAVRVVKTSGDGAIGNGTGTASSFRIVPNVQVSPNGFGGGIGYPTQLSQTPASATESGMIINAESIFANPAVFPPDPEANVGPNFADGGPGVRKILLGTLNVVSGTTDTVFSIQNYGLTQSTTQGNLGLDKTNLAAGITVGAENPLGGFYTFTVAAVIPEPSSMALCGLVACGMSYAGYRRRKTAVTASTDVA